MGGKLSRASWVGKCPVQVGWERVPSELGGNLFHQSCVGTCPVRVGWEIVPCKLDGNVSRRSWVRMLEGVRWERVPSELGGNVSRASWVGKCPMQVGWERVASASHSFWHRLRRIILASASHSS